MANSIRYNYEQMRSVAKTIRDDYKNRYVTAANKFKNDFESSTAAWEGASKDKMKAYIEGTVSEYILTQIPTLLDALANVLEENAKQMEQADQDIADSIPS